MTSKTTALARDGPSGFIVKAKTLAGGRFYEMFVENTRLCVNIRDNLVDKHAVVQSDGLEWPRGKRCRGGSSRAAADRGRSA